MAKKIKLFIILINSIRFLPHFLLYKLHPRGGNIRLDLKRYNKGFFYLMTFEKTFRNLFYARFGVFSFPLMLFAPREASLRLDHKMILGPGCKLVHSYWTYIHAKSIGANFLCLHGVTIGNYYGLPVIGNNVSVFAGACITGPITIGNNVKIGAGCVVTKSVPDNCTVIGNPAIIVKKDGQKTWIKL